MPKYTSYPPVTNFSLIEQPSALDAMMQGVEQDPTQPIPMSPAAEIIPPGRNVGGRMIMGRSEAHPLWAKTYLPGEDKIVYSNGPLALREGISGGQRYYTAIKHFGIDPDTGRPNIRGTAYDVRNWTPKSQTLTQAEADELAAVANRLEKTNPLIEGK